MALTKENQGGARFAVPAHFSTDGEKSGLGAWLWAAVGLILVGYLLVATLFAVYTPAWQAPDEPAHYNYVAYVAAGHGLPVLEMGDYDQAYLRSLIDNRFPPVFSISPIQYEYHQPPLYYISAVPIFRLSGGDLVALRLYNVLLGAGVLLLIFLIAHTIFPNRPTISLGSMALAAFLPMHVAVMAAANNDALAELLIAGSILALLRWMSGLHRGVEHGIQRPRDLLMLGVLLGLALVTKSTAYILLPVVVLTVIAVRVKGFSALPARDRVRDAKALTANLALILLPALLIALPLWIRNMAIYGGLDFLGLDWHDAVVVGQPRTAEWIALNGWNVYLDRAVEFTFKSAWGVFGWMGVFMDSRIYLALTIFTGVLFLGGLWAVIRLLLGWPDSELDRFQLEGVAVLGLLALGATTGYVWYNLSFVQHQGRYLFPGLAGIAFFMALAWREVLRPAQGVVTGLLAGVLTLSLAVIGWLSGSVDKWLLLSTGLTSALLLIQAWGAILVDRYATPGSDGLLAAWVRRPLIRWGVTAISSVAWLTPFVLLFLLDLAIPFVFLLPQLG